MNKPETFLTAFFGDRGGSIGASPLNNFDFHVSLIIRRGESSPAPNKRLRVSARRAGDDASVDRPRCNLWCVCVCVCATYTHSISMFIEHTRLLMIMTRTSRRVGCLVHAEYIRHGAVSWRCGCPVRLNYYFESFLIFV